MKWQEGKKWEGRIGIERKTANKMEGEKKNSTEMEEAKVEELSRESNGKERKREGRKIGRKLG